MCYCGVRVGRRHRRVGDAAEHMQRSLCKNVVPAGEDILRINRGAGLISHATHKHSQLVPISNHNKEQQLFPLHGVNKVHAGGSKFLNLIIFKQEKCLLKRDVTAKYLSDQSSE